MMSKSLTLKYKASNIARAEREDDRKFFDVFNELGQGAPSFGTLLFLLKAGGATEDEADVFIEEKGVGEALVIAVEALSSAGFLGDTKIDATELRKELEKAQAEALSSTGKSKKA